MKKLLRWLDRHAEESLLVLSLVLIFLISLLQVFLRNIPGLSSLPWAEELCRFLWVWTVFLSVPYALRHGCALRVTVLLEKLPHAARKIAETLCDLLGLAVFAFLSVHAAALTADVAVSAETSGAMGIPMAWVYGVIAPSFALAAFRAGQSIVRRFAGDQKEAA